MDGKKREREGKKREREKARKERERERKCRKEQYKENAMYSCITLERIAPDTAASRSASSKTMNGALPPCREKMRETPLHTTLHHTTPHHTMLFNIQPTVFGINIDNTTFNQGLPTTPNMTRAIK